MQCWTTRCRSFSSAAVTRLQVLKVHLRLLDLLRPRMFELFIVRNMRIRRVKHQTVRVTLTQVSYMNIQPQVLCLHEEL